MKKITILVIALFAMTITAQAQEIQKLFDKYANDEKFSYVSVGSGLMEFASSFIDGNIDTKTKDLLSKFKGLKVLTLESGAEKKAINSVVDEVTRIIRQDPKGEAVVETREKGEIVSIHMLSDGLLIMTKGLDELTLVFFSGNLSKESILELVSKMKKK